MTISSTRNRDIYGDDLNDQQIREYLIQRIHVATNNRYRPDEKIPVNVVAHLIQTILELVWKHADELAREFKRAR
jgi:hypothetical protein